MYQMEYLLRILIGLNPATTYLLDPESCVLIDLVKFWQTSIVESSHTRHLQTLSVCTVSLYEGKLGDNKDSRNHVKAIRAVFEQ